MSEDNRRRLGAVAALALGVFLALTLLPGNLTGPIGGWIGPGLWSAFGVGAVGLPLAGILVGLVSSTLAGIAMVRRPPWPDLHGDISSR